MCGGASACTSGMCACAAPLVRDPASGRCVDVTVDPNNCGSLGNACNADQYCSGSACVCRPGLTLVGGNCVDLQTDPNNCGTAGTVCSGGTPVCRAGACVSTGMCGGGGGLRNCSGACVNTRTDSLNCGACGQVCDVGQLCVDGGCEQYVPATTCTSCPCTACVAPRDLCTVYGTGVICSAGG